MITALTRLYDWHPGVGIFISILAVVGVLVPWFRAERTSRLEKALWTFIMFALVGLELRSIVLFDRDQQRSAKEQNDRFDLIAEGLKTTIENSHAQFTATMGRMRQLAGMSQTALDEITGGESFCYVEIRNGFIGSPLAVSLTGKGKHPLSDVQIRIAELGDPTFGLGKEIHLPSANRYDGFAKTIASFPQPHNTTDKTYNVFIFALNGSFTEHILLHRPPDIASWSSAYQVTAVFYDGAKSHGLVLENVDLGFPVDLLTRDKEWNSTHAIKRYTTRN